MGIKNRDIDYSVTVQGALCLSALVGNYYESRIYFGYTKSEATEMFKAEFA